MALAWAVRVGLARARYRPAAHAAVLLSLLVAVLVTTTCQVVASSLRDAGTAHALTALPVDQSTFSFTGTADVRLAERDRAVRRHAAAIPGARTVRWVVAPALRLVVPAAQRPTKVLVADCPDARRAAALASGRWPDAPREVALPVVVARTLHRAPGTSITLTRVAPAHGDVTLRVVGTYEPRATDALVWRDDLLGGRGVSDTGDRTLGPLLLADADPAVLTDAAQVAWRVASDPGRAPDDTDLDSAARGWRDDPALRDVRGPSGDLAASLAEARTAGDATARLVLPVLVLLLAVAMVSAMLTGLLLATAHAADEQLVAARGASLGQRTLLALPLAGAALILAAVGVGLAGPLAGVVLGIPARATAATWLCALLVTLAALALTAVAAGRPPGTAGRAAGTIAVLAGAALAWWRLPRSAGRDDLGSLAGPAVVLTGTAVLAVLLSVAATRPWRRVLTRARGVSALLLAARWARRDRGGWWRAVLVALVSGVLVVAGLRLGSLVAHVDARVTDAAPAPAVLRLVPGVPGAAQAVARHTGSRSSPVWTGDEAQGDTSVVRVVGLDPIGVERLGLPLAATTDGRSWREWARSWRDVWGPDRHGGRPAGVIEVDLVTRKGDPIAKHQPVPTLTADLDDATGWRSRITLRPVDPRPGATVQTYRADVARPDPSDARPSVPVGPVRVAIVRASYGYLPADEDLLLGGVREVDARGTHEQPSSRRPGTVLSDGTQVFTLQPAPRQPLRVLATQAYLDAVHLAPGDVTYVTVGGHGLRVVVDGAAERLPGLGTRPGVVADLRALQQTTVVEAPAGELARPPLVPDTVWLPTAPDLADLPQGAPVDAVTTPDATRRALTTEPRVMGVRSSFVLLVTGAVLLALVGALSAAAVLVRDRHRERTVLHALGARAGSAPVADLLADGALVLVTALMGALGGCLLVRRADGLWGLGAGDGFGATPWPVPVVVAVLTALTVVLAPLPLVLSRDRSPAATLRRGDRS